MQGVDWLQQSLALVGRNLSPLFFAPPSRLSASASPTHRRLLSFLLSPLPLSLPAFTRALALAIALASFVCSSYFLSAHCPKLARGRDVALIRCTRTANATRRTNHLHALIITFFHRQDIRHARRARLLPAGNPHHRARIKHLRSYHFGSRIFPGPRTTSLCHTKRHHHSKPHPSVHLDGGNLRRARLHCCGKLAERTLFLCNLVICTLQDHRVL